MRSCCGILIVFGIPHIDDHFTALEQSICGVREELVDMKEELQQTNILLQRVVTLLETQNEITKNS